MIDIFSDIKPQPKLYIADVKISVSYKVRSKMETVNLNLKKIPIVLLNGKHPTNVSRIDFFRRLYDIHIKKGKFEKTTMKIISIENTKFSSNLAYEFNYDKH